MTREPRTPIVLAGLAVVFCFLVAAFSLELWGRPEEAREIPLVDPSFLETKTWRQSYADLVAAEEDVSYFECYICHEEDKELKLTFDEQGQIVLPEEHEDIVMGHGTHGRNNNCYNCHSEKNLVVLQARDGHELKMEESTLLCGSCHGPSLRDWTSGSHGRTSGYWDRSKGEFTKLQCVNCHDPHSPQFPSRKPAPGPNYLRVRGGTSHQTTASSGAPDEAEPAPDEAELDPDEAEPDPDEAESDPDEAEPAPDEAEPAPDEAEPAPGEAEPAPDEAEPAPGEAEPDPDEAEPAPGEAEPAPGEAEPAPDEAEPAPDEAEPAPDEAEPAPEAEPTRDDATESN